MDRHRLSSFILIVTITACTPSHDVPPRTDAAPVPPAPDRYTWIDAPVTMPREASAAESESESEFASESETSVASESESETESEQMSPSCPTGDRSLIVNGDFECQPFSACGWEEYDNTVWGILITPDCIDPTRPGCAAYLETMEWGGFWDAQFYQRVSLEPGARYRLEFEAKANRLTRSITVALVSGGPMTDTRSEDDLGFVREFYLAPSWEWHTATFTAEESDEDAAFVFAFSAEEPGFFMDNVALACALE